jgi:cytochrome c5
MKKICTITLLAASVLFLVNCSNKTGKAIASKSGSHADTVAYTPEQLHEGMTLYQGSCQQCHKLHDPAEFTTGKWNRILGSMIPRTQLSESNAMVVRAYVLANAKKD